MKNLSNWKKDSTFLQQKTVFQIAVLKISKLPVSVMVCFGGTWSRFRVQEAARILEKGSEGIRSTLG